MPAVKSKPKKKPRSKKQSKAAVEYQAFQRVEGKKSRVGPKVVDSSADTGTAVQDFSESVSGPQLSIEQLGSGIRAEGNVIAKGEVIQQSTTERRIFETVNNTIELAKEVSSRWQQKEKNLGKTVYHCPFCDPRSREPFPTPAAARKHIKTSHPKQLELSHLQKAAPSVYEPIPVLISPKRTLEDFVPASQVDRVRKMQVAQDAFKASQTKQVFDRSGEIKATSLLMKPESLAVPDIRKLSDKELVVLVRLAFARDKRILLKVSRNICKDRDITPPF